MDWKRLIDKTLGTNFDAPQYDPQKGRDKLIKAINTAAKQHTEGSTKAPNRSWKLGGNNAIRFVPTLNGNPMMLDDGHPLYVPAEHFQTLLTEMKASVQNGDLDKQIKAALEGEKGAASTSAPRTASTGNKGVREPIANVRSSVARSMTNGKSLDEIEAALKAGGKFTHEDIDAVIAEKRAKA